MSDSDSNYCEDADDIIYEQIARYKALLNSIAEMDDPKDITMKIRQRLAELSYELNMLSYECDNIIYDHEKRQRDRAIKAEAERLALLRETNTIASLSDLIAIVQNEPQRYVLNELAPCRNDYSRRLYLVDYTPNTSADKRKAHVAGKFTILGAVNAKGARESYEVSFHKFGAKPRPFWCSCPYHKYKSSKEGTMCKHISFIIVRFAKLFDPLIFENLTLSEEQHAKLTELLVQPLRETLAKAMPKHLDNFLVAADRAFGEDEVCAICYEEFVAPGATSADVSKLVCCPGCRQVVHKNCVAVWMERSTSCVYCRSDCWGKYREFAPVIAATAQAATAAAAAAAGPSTSAA